MKKRRPGLQRSDRAWLTVTCFVVLLQFWWLPGNRGTSADSFSTSIEGSRGLFQTLKALSDQHLLPPARRETEQLIPDKPCTLLMLGPERYPNEYEQDELRQFMTQGGCVVFAPNWMAPDYDGGSLRFKSQPVETQIDVVVPVTVPKGGGNVPLPGDAGSSSKEDPRSEPTEVGRDTMMAESETDVSDASSASDPAPAAPAPQPAPIPLPAPAARIEDELSKSPGLLPPNDPTAPLQQLDNTVLSQDVESESQLVDGRFPWRTTARLSDFPSSAEVLVRTTEGHAQVVSWSMGRGSLVVSASADPFSNRSMLFERQAEFAVRLVEYAVDKSRPYDDPEIVMSEYLNGAGTYSGPQLLISPALRSGTLQLLLAGVLLGWFGFHRFGPAIQNHESQRRSLAESATAVGNLQFRTNDGGTSVKSYLDWFRTECRKRFGHDRGLDDIPSLARHTGISEEDLRDTIDTARSLSATPYVAPHDAATSIRNLSQIHQRLIGTGEV